MKKAIIVASILGLLLVPVFAFAGDATAIAETGGLSYGTELEIGTRDIRASAVNLVNVILGILGIVALIIILYGGFIWMTAQGNDENTSKARGIIISGVIGMIIIIAAYAIARFVIEQLYTNL